MKHLIVLETEYRIRNLDKPRRTLDDTVWNLIFLRRVEKPKSKNFDATSEHYTVHSTHGLWMIVQMNHQWHKIYKTKVEGICTEACPPVLWASSSPSWTSSFLGHRSTSHTMRCLCCHLKTNKWKMGEMLEKYHHHYHSIKVHSLIVCLCWTLTEWYRA